MFYLKKVLFRSMVGVSLLSLSSPSFADFDSLPEELAVEVYKLSNNGSSFKKV